MLFERRYYPEGRRFNDGESGPEVIARRLECSYVDDLPDGYRDIGVGGWGDYDFPPEDLTDTAALAYLGIDDGGLHVDGIDLPEKVPTPLPLVPYFCELVKRVQQSCDLCEISLTEKNKIANRLASVDFSSLERAFFSLVDILVHSGKGFSDVELKIIRDGMLEDLLNVFLQNGDVQFAESITSEYLEYILVMKNYLLGSCFTEEDRRELLNYQMYLAYQVRIADLCYEIFKDRNLKILLLPDQLQLKFVVIIDIYTRYLRKNALMGMDLEMLNLTRRQALNGLVRLSLVMGRYEI